MAEFDAQQGDAQQGDVQQEQSRLTFLERYVHFLVNQDQQLQSIATQPPPQQQLPRPHLNLPQPPPFSRIPSELPLFKLKLLHFLVGNRTTYHDPETQPLFAGSLLTGLVGHWYMLFNFVVGRIVLLPNSVPTSIELILPTGIHNVADVRYVSNLQRTRITLWIPILNLDGWCGDVGP